MDEREKRDAEINKALQSIEGLIKGGSIDQSLTEPTTEIGDGENIENIISNITIEYFDSYINYCKNKNYQESFKHILKTIFSSVIGISYYYYY